MFTIHNFKFNLYMYMHIYIPGVYIEFYMCILYIIYIRTGTGHSASCNGK